MFSGCRHHYQVIKYTVGQLLVREKLLMKNEINVTSGLVALVAFINIVLCKKKMLSKVAVAPYM